MRVISIERLMEILPTTNKNVVDNISIELAWIDDDYAQYLVTYLPTNLTYIVIFFHNDRYILSKNKEKMRDLQKLTKVPITYQD